MAEDRRTQGVEPDARQKVAGPVALSCQVLSGSRIGEIAALARHSGDQWWVAVINGSDGKKDFSFDLDFIGAGDWNRLSYADAPGEKTKLKIGKSGTKAGETITVSMEPGGGFAMILGKR